MGSKTIECVRRDLQWMRDHLMQRLRRIREDAAHRSQPLSADSSDRAQESENDEVLERLDRLEILPQATQCVECAGARAKAA